MKTLFEFFDPPIMRLCLLISGGMIGLAGYNWLPWASLTPSDYGVWVGAIGTVGALIGTIWIANSTERRRKHEAHDRAVVAAVSLIDRLRQVSGSAQFVINSLQGHSPGAAKHHYAAMSEALEAAGSWEDDEILPLVAFNGHVAADLAAARSSIKFCLGILKNCARLSEATRTPIPKVEETLLPRLNSVRVTVRSAHDEFQKFLRSE